MKLLILNGPNLNYLGKRNVGVYGSQSLLDLERQLLQQNQKITFDFFQSNSEGELIDKLYKSDADGVVLNAGAYTHYSFALRDAIEAISIPVVEVHISNVYQRERFRRNDVLGSVCIGSISGLGLFGYHLAVLALLEVKKHD